VQCKKIVGKLLSAVQQKMFVRQSATDENARVVHEGGRCGSKGMSRCGT
jgi:hypothetical protein